jgi:transcriptional regulator with GAF, ATPase, and Fis domain
MRIASRGMNLSRTGLAVHMLLESEIMRNAVLPGAVVSVAFRLSALKELVRLRGGVVWVQEVDRESVFPRRVRLGIRFSEPIPDALPQFLESFCHHIAVVGCPEAYQEATELGERYAPTHYTDLEALREASVDRMPSLLILGTPFSDSLSVSQFRTMFAHNDAGLHPSILLLVSRLRPEIAALLANDLRLSYLVVPSERMAFELAVQRALQSARVEEENTALSMELRGALSQLKRENAMFRDVLKEPSSLGGMVGHSDAMQRVYEQVERVAPLDSSVVIFGETGTGKGMVACAIHERSRRSSGPFLVQNCAAVSESLLDSELFGHRRGAFTGADQDRIGVFEAAHGGTLFLDEIAEMSKAMQAKVLHVLQDGVFRPVGSTKTVQVDARVVCASHQPLEKLVQEGLFREDLFYRLVSFVVKIPSLRDRPEDIGPMVLHFASRFARQYKVEPLHLTSDAMAELEDFSWPGNVRQLQFVVERLMILRPIEGRVGRGVVREALGLDSDEQNGHPTVPQAQLRPSRPPRSDSSLREVLREEERTRVLQALDESGGVIADAARVLGMNRTTLSKRMKRMGIQRPD